MNELKKLKVYQEAIDYYFNGQEPDGEYSFLFECFDGNVDEINDLLVWRKEDKEHFIKKLTKLLRLVIESKPEDINENIEVPIYYVKAGKHKTIDIEEMKREFDNKLTSLMEKLE